MTNQQAIKILNGLEQSLDAMLNDEGKTAFCMAITALELFGDSEQFERDTPMKPLETTDTAWGIPTKQAVCPKCDYYLGHVAFLDDYKGKRITYCETCGQAIDWSDWDFDITERSEDEQGKQ